ncbi:hypothetical protein ACLKA7_011537 [Drosophila subpalustris]
MLRRYHYLKRDKPVKEDITSEIEAPERPEMDGYMSDASSLTRDLRKLWQTGDLEVTSDIASDDEDANSGGGQSCRCH